MHRTPAMLVVSPLLVALALLALGMLAPATALAKLPDAAPALPPPSGNVVNVSTASELLNAVNSITSGTTIMIQAGTYVLPNTLNISGGVSNVALRGATGDRNDVVLYGQGMTNPSYGNVPHGIMVSNATDVLIADLSVGDVWFHPITLQGVSGADRVTVRNVRMFDAGEQFLKSGPDGAGGGVDDSIVEYCVMEYTTTARDDYTNGVDVHTGDNWIIRHNLFRNILAPVGQLAGPSVLMWNYSTNTICEGNTFINCQRAIAFGLTDRSTGTDHAGGIIRNNFIYVPATIHWADAAIIAWDSPNTKILHNTVLANGTYPNAIEYRFASTTGVEIAANLLDAAIVARNGATGTVQNNITSATAGLFVDPTNGDLHLLPSAAVAIDQVSVHADAAVDFDEDGRPAGAAADIGADEYGGIPPNQAPIAVAAIVGPGTVSNAHTLDGSGSYDPDTGPQPLTYSWTQTAGPAVTIQNATAVSASFTPTAAGTYTFELTVDDSDLTGTDSDTVVVTDPTLTFDTSTWTLNASDQTLLPLTDSRQLTYNGSGTLTVTVNASESWLTASFDNGAGGNTLSPGASGTVTIEVASLASLSPGTFTATLTVTGDDGVPHVVAITIELVYSPTISGGGRGCALGWGTYAIDNGADRGFAVVWLALLALGLGLAVARRRIASI